MSSEDYGFIDDHECYPGKVAGKSTYAQKKVCSVWSGTKNTLDTDVNLLQLLSKTSDPRMKYSCHF